ncbi:sulfate/molybdate ABC transporter ATP-binding protein [Mycolicibacterium thermoresistibile]
MTELRVTADAPSRRLHLEFTVPAGEVLAVLGPNGAGKSSTLHLIAGLLRPARGSVQIGERVLTDTATATFVPTHDRRVGLLLQDALLFPHLDVAANVAFGPHSRSGVRQRWRRSPWRAAAQRWLTEVDAVELADRMPRQLSGGQAQRVALARALAAEPEVLLLDEPLAGLDVAVAASMRRLLRRVLTRAGRSAVVVTHDLLDVLALADRVLVLEGGRVAESGPAASVLAAPRSQFAARIAGVNLVAGTAGADAALHTAWGATWFGVADPAVVTGRPAVAVIAPAAVSVYREAPQGSPRNTIAVTVADLEVHGSTIRVRAVDQPDGAPGLAADVTAESAAALGLAPGDRVHFAVKAQEVAIHPAP